MPRKKQIHHEEKVGLKLTAAQRTLLEGLTLLPPEYEEAVRSTPPSQPIMLTLDELDDLSGYVAAEANYTDDKTLERKLDAIFEKIQHLLESHSDEEPTKALNIEDAKLEKIILVEANRIADWVADAIVAAEQLGIKQKPLDHFSLSPAERESVLSVSGISGPIKSKLAKDKAAFTVAEVASMTFGLAEELTNEERANPVVLLVVLKHLLDGLQDGIIGHIEPKSKKRKAKAKPATGTLFQFKITLLGSSPPIWRRIQIQDCTLDKLHEHIQTAMGWTNSHLHQFQIGEQRYGDPDLMEDGFEEFDMADSTRTMLSQVIPLGIKKLRFQYEYDFGDGWEHEIVFEGNPPVDPKAKYPLCMEGARACPPEDCGGIWGYADFLEAIKDPKHEEHESYMEWIGDKFDAEAFDPKKATREMKKGLPDWREME